MKYTKIKVLKNANDFNADLDDPNSFTEKWITTRCELITTAYDIATDTLGINGVCDDYIWDDINAASNESLIKYIDAEYDASLKRDIEKLKVLIKS